jgi:chromosome segregation protein
VADAERSLAEALGELGATRAARQVKGEALAALRRVEAARTAELETGRRRLANAERQAVDERTQADEGARRMEEAEAACAGPKAALARAVVEERAAVAAREAARAELDRLEGARQPSAERSAAAATRVAGLRGRLDAANARLAEDEARGIARAARKVGGRPLAEGLEVEAGFRVAVEAALGAAMRGYVVGRDVVAELGGQRGVLVLDAELPAEGSRRGARADGRDHMTEAGEAATAAAIAHLGGRLLEAIRVDPGGTASRLLARSVWVPDIVAALAVQQRLPAGWIVVTRDGGVVTSFGVVTVGRAESLLERRAEIDRLGEELARGESEAALAGAAATDAGRAAAGARVALDAAREAERQAGSNRHEAEEAERRATRALEAVAREAAWRSAQAVRVEAERDRLRAAVRQAAAPDAAGPAAAASGADAAMGPAAAGTADSVASAGTADRSAADSGDDRASALREWEARAASLRARRDQLAGEEATLEAVRREAEARHARASATANLGQDRMAGLERQMTELAERERHTGSERGSLGEELAAAAIREAALRLQLEELRAAASAARTRLAEAEAAASYARERLRICQEGVRSAEVAEMEARLALDSIREQVLLELAGLGDLGLRLLASEAEGDADDGDAATREIAPAGGIAEDADSISTESLEAALADATARWSTASPVEPPGPAKLAAFRRRFHELGAPNPFAAEEYQAIKTRLDGLEAQRSDLTHAISKTRALIEQLNAMIATQFRSTFAALETAFGARFRQLFGGGYARLSLTEPEDLAATGIEIVARPPGKKAQPLSMLSGGERALTAVALLFAMLEVHPVPFCVLDEVDAALDEANIGRFAEALRGLADQTQIIVITHNRGTIETADALYGVTVGDDAVSRVISLRLEEARELADQVSNENAASAAG